MTRDNEADDSTRRTVLKTLAAAGVAGAGIAGASGSAAAQGQRSGGRFQRLSFDYQTEGEFTDAIDDAEAPPRRFDAGDEVTFDGEIVFTDLDVNENDELVASGRVKGRLSGNPTEQINETFEDQVLGLLEEILGILSPEDPGECPILELVIEPIFLDLLGLQVETSTIELDITAIAGEGNLLGNLLCAVAGLLDP